MPSFLIRVKSDREIYDDYRIHPYEYEMDSDLDEDEVRDEDEDSEYKFGRHLFPAGYLEPSCRMIFVKGIAYKTWVYLVTTDYIG